MKPTDWLLLWLVFVVFVHFFGEAAIAVMLACYYAWQQIRPSSQQSEDNQ